MQPGLGHGRAPGRAPSTVRPSAGCERRRRRPPAGVGLGVGDLAVAVGVEVEACLEGRDLGLVDDDVEEDPVRLDADPGVVVDREVAERVGGGERGDEQRSDQPSRTARPARVGATRATASREVGVVGDRWSSWCVPIMPQDAAPRSTGVGSASSGDTRSDPRG